MECPHCAGILQMDEDWIGIEGECPVCGKDIIISKEPVEKKKEKLRVKRPEHQTYNSDVTPSPPGNESVSPEKELQPTPKMMVWVTPPDQWGYNETKWLKDGRKCPRCGGTLWKLSSPNPSWPLGLIMSGLVALFRKCHCPACGKIPNNELTPAGKK